MTTSTRVHPALRVGVALVVLGIAGVALAVAADRGRFVYFAGAVCVLLGVWCLVWATLRNWRGIVAGVLSAVLVLGAAFVALDGWPWSGPDRWQSDGAVASDHGVVGGLLFSGAGGRERSTGEMRWHSPDPERDMLVVATPTAVVINHPETDTRGLLIGYEPGTGKRLWAVKASPYIRGVTFHGDVVVTTQTRHSRFRAVAYDLRTGGTVWQRSGLAAAELDLRQPRNWYSWFQRPSAGVFLATGADPEQPDEVTVLRTEDGRSVLKPKHVPLSARFVGDTCVSLDGDTMTADSLNSGKRLWKAAVPPTFTFFGDGSSIVLASTGDPAVFTEVDVRSGTVHVVRPPAGVTVGDFDMLERQRGSAVWIPVQISGGLGVWRVGSRQVVPVPEAQSIGLGATDANGWIGLSGTTEDAVGDEHAASWAVSPGGTLSGPFPGNSISVAPGIATVGDTTYLTRS
ncbi:MAG TPA: hypothetical protein VG502_13450 [Flexivirga sp.]|uniref:hypothetical protein n=1 Tax=Flexivirga sp. TaxID=1962927 RepID=UPI002B722606|nr:hypothetical protein [Flexivirga sp.]HWC23298.1 hypothetical protein [Flexivirga sp.]